MLKRHLYHKLPKTIYDVMAEREKRNSHFNTYKWLVPITICQYSDVPPLGNPDEGKIVLFVDCSANATHEFEGRGGKDCIVDSSVEKEICRSALRRCCIATTKVCSFAARQRF